MTEFETFWAEFPRRTGRLAAQRAFQKARTLASLEQILDGVRRYVANKPAYADFCHPTTFLSQGRWMDEPDRRSGTERRAYEPWVCLHQPRCGNRATCAVVSARKVS